MAGRVLFVNPAAPPGGSGTRAAPLSSLRAAVQQSSSGTLIALSKGAHVVAGPLPREVTLWGACVAETTLTSTTNVPAIAFADVPGVEVRNLRISGLGSGARAIGAGASLRLTDVLIDGVDGAGVGAVDGATVTATSVVVRNLRAAGTVALGVASIGGATLEATRLVTEGLEGRALHVTATATVRDSVLLDTDVLGPGQTTEAVWAAQGGALTLERTAILGTRGAGLVVGQRSRVQVSDVLVADSVQTPGGPTERGQGVVVLDGALQADRLWLVGNTGYGLQALGAAASAVVEDSLIDGTKVSTETNGGIGVSVGLGARGTLERVVVRDSASGGFEAMGVGAVLSLTDCVAERTRMVGDTGGLGLFVTEGSSVTVTRARFEDNTWDSVLVAGALEASDVVVRGTKHATGGLAIGGNGLSVSRGTATLSRWRFEGNQGSGLFIGSGQLTGADVAVVDASPVRTELASSGVVVLGGSTTLTRLRIEGAVGIGIAGFAEGSLVASEVLVSGTRPRACVTEGCPPPAVGVLSIQRARVQLSRFLVSGNGGFGLAVDQGQLDAAQGEVSDHAIGLNVRDPGYDLSRLDQGVRYLRNQTKLAAEVIPLPMIPAPR
jgi:hypothetical protein